MGGVMEVESGKAKIESMRNIKDRLIVINTNCHPERSEGRL